MTAAAGIAMMMTGTTNGFSTPSLVTRNSASRIPMTLEASQQEEHDEDASIMSRRQMMMGTFAATMAAVTASTNPESASATYSAYTNR